MSGLESDTDRSKRAKEESLKAWRVYRSRVLAEKAAREARRVAFEHLSATKKPKSKALPDRRDRGEALMAAEILYQAFSWADTPQRGAYWLRVYRNLRTLAGAEP